MATDTLKIQLFFKDILTWVPDSNRNQANLIYIVSKRVKEKKEEADLIYKKVLDFYSIITCYAW